MRIIRVLRPRIVVVENVTGLTPWLGRVLGPLAALGFDAAWDVFGACCVGAPHQRERLFIVASHPDREPVRSQQVGEQERIDQDVAGDDGKPREVAGRMRGAWAAQPGVCRVGDGIPDRLDRLKALGNAVVPAQAELAISELLRRLES